MNAPNGQPIAELWQDHARVLALKMDQRKHLEKIRRQHKRGIAEQECELVKVTSWVLLSEFDVMASIIAVAEWKTREERERENAAQQRNARSYRNGRAQLLFSDQSLIEARGA